MAAPALNRVSAAAAAPNLANRLRSELLPASQVPISDPPSRLSNLFYHPILMSPFGTPFRPRPLGSRRNQEWLTGYGAGFHSFFRRAPGSDVVRACSAKVEPAYLRGRRSTSHRPC